MIRAIIFDFDGTLVDIYSIEEQLYSIIASEVNRLISPKVDNNSLKLILMETSKKLEMEGIYNRKKWWEKALEQFSIKVEESTLENISKVYWKELVRLSRTYDDISALEKFRRMKLKLGLLTNTDGTPGIKRGRINKSGLEKFFDVIIVAGDDIPYRKPDIRTFKEIVKKLNVESENALYVGDNLFVDSKCREIGMKFALVLREHNKDILSSGNLIDDANVDYTIAQLDELIEYLS